MWHVRKLRFIKINLMEEYVINGFAKIGKRTAVKANVCFTTVHIIHDL